MTYQVLDPTSGIDVIPTRLAPRVNTLTNATVGFISNGKEGTDRFFAHLKNLLREELGVGEVLHRRKSNYSAPADSSIVTEAAQWDLTIAGIGD
jgi:hypothetical protein